MTPDATASLRSQVARPLKPPGRALRPICPNPQSHTTRRSRSSAPADPTRGDFASNIALRLAKPYRRAPLEIAAAIAAHVATTATDPNSPIVSVEVAPPGFLNIRLADHALAATTQQILRNPTTWAASPPKHPEHINVEFVSANPTGPLHIGNARGAFTGDLLCRVLTAAGHQVEREYYFKRFSAAR